MIPPELFDSAVSALSQHQLFISDISEVLQRDPDYLHFHFQSAWLWIASILAAKKVHVPFTLPHKTEVEKLVRAAIDRSAQQKNSQE